MYVAKVAMSRAVSVALKACQLRTHIIPTPAPVQQTGGTRAALGWHSGGTRVALVWQSEGGGLGGRGADVRHSSFAWYGSGVCGFETVFGHVWSPPPLLVMPVL